jgi:transglutaminase/protease-like cytokinesis protein 3
MRQKMLQLSASSAIVLAGFLAVYGAIGHSSARAETFDIRFAAVETVQKGDRLGTPAVASGSSVVFYSDPRAALTIATKIEVAAKNESSNKTRVNPAENVQQEKQQKKKMLVGCEPSFSPVTTPSMANVTGRCLAAMDHAVKFAELAR